MMSMMMNLTIFCYYTFSILKRPNIDWSEIFPNVRSTMVNDFSAPWISKGFEGFLVTG